MNIKETVLEHVQTTMREMRLLKKVTNWIPQENNKRERPKITREYAGQ